MTSLRRFLIISVLSALMLVNFIAALHGYRSSMLEAENLFDQKLSEMAAQFAAMPLPNVESPPSADDEQMVFQIFSGEGKLLWRSVHAPAQIISEVPGFGEHNFNDYRWRTLSYLNPNSGRRVVVAERVDQRYRLAESVILESVVPVVLVLPVAGILIWLIIGHGLSSLGVLAGILRRKSPDDFGAIRVDGAPVELLPVIQSVNSMLSRLSASFERERRFSADAAHELRTPISAIKMHLHNVRDELPNGSDSLRSLTKDVDRLAHLVEQMLLLHRTTPDHYPAKFEKISLRSLARDAIAERYADCAAKQQTIELAGDAVTVDGDGFALGILLQNLVNNASKYTQQGGRIELRTEVKTSEVWLTVADNGPGISAEAKSRVFERFYRLGGDRHSSGASGCGLGLSIVEHIAELHGAKIVMKSGLQSRGLAVSIVFPASLRSDKALTPNAKAKKALGTSREGEQA
ncbi:ATP-binding protein [Zhongshania sp.]|jgi:two-component system sensor histidine kinase QseC|uniref:ATP-binding protein n=1 Tax=Zhongshania sp. TaxID=1971902 RepID=UPI002A8279C1|nr:ATP-binding protein [Zhongshania sp.]